MNPESNGVGQRGKERTRDGAKERKTVEEAGVETNVQSHLSGMSTRPSNGCIKWRFTVEICIRDCSS